MVTLCYYKGNKGKPLINSKVYMSKSLISAPKTIRVRWYLQVDKYRKSVTEVCKIFGISRKTYYKWYSIDHPIGRTGKRPRRIHPQTKLTGNLKITIINAKLKYNYGPKKMSIYLRRSCDIEVSPSTIYKFYKKKNLIRKPQKQQKWYTPLKEPFLTEYPGENVQLDVKYVPGIDFSWSYQYRFIDQKTNLQYSITLESRDALSSIHAFKKAKKYFPFIITGIQTDNGGEFRGKFHEYLVRQKIVQRYIPKKSAPWNGKVERANRSIDDEYYLNPTRPWTTVQQYTNWYNYERPHLGKEMDGITPYEKYLQCMQKCNP